MEFQAITTQEEFDKAVKDRLKRQEEQISSKYSDYDSLKSQNDELTKQVVSLTDELNSKNTSYSELETKFNESNSKIAKYESDSVKTKIAIEAGLPYEMIDRIKGDSEDEIKADVDSLMSFVGKSEQTQPLFQSNEGVGDSKDQEYKKMVNMLNNKE